MPKIRLTYDELHKRCELIGAPDVRHSDYKDTSDGGDWDQRVLEVESFDTVVKEGRVRFTRNFEGWKGSFIDNPTVADGLRAMQESMKATGDEHHVFFEGLGKPKAVEVGTCEHCGHAADPGTVVFEIEIHTGS